MSALAQTTTVLYDGVTTPHQGGQYVSGRDSPQPVLDCRRKDGRCQEAVRRALVRQRNCYNWAHVALKGGRYRPFYRWITANLGHWFPRMPEQSRLLRLLRDYSH